MNDCTHFPIQLDESGFHPAPSLVVCLLCGECLDAVIHEPAVEPEYEAIGELMECC